MTTTTITKKKNQSIQEMDWIVCQNPNIQSPLWSHDNNVPDPKASEELKHKVHKSDWPFLCYFLSFLERQFLFEWASLISYSFDLVKFHHLYKSMPFCGWEIMSQKLSIDFNLFWTQKLSLNLLSNVSSVIVNPVSVAYDMGDCFPWTQTWCFWY